MDASGWILFAAASALAMAGAFWLYRRRETPGRGRTVLALLRWAALSVILLLLFDPVVRSSAAPAARRPQVLLDASISMTVPAEPGGETRWQRAAAEAARLAQGRPVILFGSGARAVSADSLSDLSPTETSSRLLPALQAAAEAGAGRVIVLTDGAVADAADVRRWLPGLGLEVDFRVVGDTSVANQALIEVEAPRWAQAGEPAEVRFGVASTGPGQDSVRVALFRDGEVVGRAAAARASSGRVATGTLRFTPEAGPDDAVRYEIAIEGDDAVAADDRRSVYIRVSDRPAGVTLISLRPDWEPRFLLPALSQALGMPVQGFLSTRDGFVRAAMGSAAGERVNGEAVRAAARSADLLVLHGVDAATPQWALDEGRAARRLLVLPAGMIEGLGVPVEVAGPMGGEWYPSGDVPASPVAGLLAGLSVADAPPLTALSRVEAPTSAWIPLLATRGRRGEPLPLMVAGETAGRRWAVATGDGYWRWAFRGGTSADLYRRLWSSVAGWLVREQSAVAASAVWPSSSVLTAGEAAQWVAPGLEADSLRVRLIPLDVADREPVETTRAIRRDTASLPPVTPGRYRYEAVALRADSIVAESTGEMTADSYSPDFSLPRIAAGDLRTEAVALGGITRAGGRPVHTMPWPYLVLIVLIAAEWVLRRRWGLR